MCLDKCLRELEHQSRLARENEAKKRREAGMAPSRIAEEGAAATGDAEGAESAAECVMPVAPVLLHRKSFSDFVRLTKDAVYFALGVCTAMGAKSPHVGD